MDDNIINSAILKCLVDLKSEISSIKEDIVTINKNLEEIKKEHNLYRSAFPNGIDDHREFHKKKRFIFF